MLLRISLLARGYNMRQHTGKIFLTITGILLLILMLVYITDGITGQQEPTSPDANVFDATGAVQPTAQAVPPTPFPPLHPTYKTPEDNQLPPPLEGTLPPTMTGQPDFVTPVLVLPSSEPPSVCRDCAGQQPGINVLLRWFASIKQLYRKT
jgi:hypothetical protein